MKSSGIFYTLSLFTFMIAVAKRIEVSLANHIDLIPFPNSRDSFFSLKAEVEGVKSSGGIFWTVSSGSVSASQQSPSGQKLT